MWRKYLCMDAFYEVDVHFMERLILYNVGATYGKTQFVILMK